MNYFNTVGLVGRRDSHAVIDSLRVLIPFLKTRNLTLIIDSTIGELLPGHGLEERSAENMGRSCDLVIVVGGDGSMLGAARALAAFCVPVLGVNRGNLGFLTDIHPEEVEQKVGEVLDGRYTLETRFLIDAFVRRDGQTVGEGTALNDVILHPGEAARMIRFELYIDDQFVYSQRSDGLIVATPTGSTAYALSGGGPIMHPGLDALVLVPMFPHTLTSRPIVVDGDVELKLVIGEQPGAYPHISCDGQQPIACAPGDVITIRKTPHRLKLIHPVNYNFYETCRSKLGWGTKLGK